MNCENLFINGKLVLGFPMDLLSWVWCDILAQAPHNQGIQSQWSEQTSLLKSGKREVGKTVPYNKISQSFFHLTSSVKQTYMNTLHVTYLITRLICWVYFNTVPCFQGQDGPYQADQVQGWGPLLPLLHQRRRPSATCCCGWAVSWRIHQLLPSGYKRQLIPSRFGHWEHYSHHLVRLGWVKVYCRTSCRSKEDELSGDALWVELFLRLCSLTR